MTEDDLARLRMPQRLALAYAPRSTRAGFAALFLLDAPTVGVRINWKEFQGLRDDSVPVDPVLFEWSGRPVSGFRFLHWQRFGGAFLRRGFPPARLSI